MSTATAPIRTQSCGPIAHFRARRWRRALRRIWICPRCATTCQPLDQADIDFMEARYPRRRVTSGPGWPD